MSITATPDPNPRRSYGLLSRVIRRWPLILALWMLISAGIVYLIHVNVQPTYEAFSTLVVAPASPRLFELPRSENVDYNTITPYLQTQVNLITSDRVLGVAIANPDVVNLRTIRESDDPRSDLRDRMDVEIVKDAYMIRVALKLPNGDQAAKIVNAVVYSYLAYNSEYRRGKNSTLRAGLVSQLEKFRNEIDEKRAALKSLRQKSGIDLPLAAITLKEPVDVSDPIRSPIAAVSETQAARIADELINTELELIKSRAILETTEAANKGANDPGLQKNLGDLRLKLTALLKQREYQARYLKGLKVETKTGTEDPIEATLVKREMETLIQRHEQIKTNVQQLDFEADQEDYRVVPIDPAVPPKVPTHDKGIEYMAIAPLAVLLALFGLALLSPVRNGRARTGV